MPRRPSPSFDYAYLAGFQQNADNPYELFYLSPASQKVLAQLAEIVLWRDTRWYNGDDADIIALSGQIYEELKVPQHLDDLIPLLDDIEPLLTQLLARPCCENLNQGQPTGGDGGSIYPIPGPFPYPIPDNDTSPGAGEYPITPATDPDDGGTMTEEEWGEYACGVANWLFDSVIDWLNFARFLIGLQYGTVQLIDMIVGQIAAAALPGQLDDLAVWTLPTYTEIFTEWGQSITQGTIDTAVSQLDAIRDDIVCGIAGEYTAADAIAAILNLISGEITSAGILALLESPIALVASLAWNGLIDTPWDDGCECAGELAVGITGVRYTIHDHAGSSFNAKFQSVQSPVDPVWSGSQQDWAVNDAGLPKNVERLSAGGENSKRPALRWGNTGFTNGSIGTISATINQVQVSGQWHTVVSLSGVTMNHFNYGGSDPTVSGTTITWPAHNYPVSQTGYAEVHFTCLI